MQDLTFEILGGSQTFLGTLATIIILFILEDKSNLIKTVLDEIRTRIEGQLSLLKKTKTSYDEIYETSDYKLLKLSLERDTLDAELRNEILETISDISSQKSDFSTMFLSVESNDKQLLNNISDAKEKNLAPLYTLLFTLCIFIF